MMMHECFDTVIYRVLSSWTRVSSIKYALYSHSRKFSHRAALARAYYYNDTYFICTREHIENIIIKIFADTPYWRRRDLLIYCMGRVAYYFTWAARFYRLLLSMAEDAAWCNLGRRRCQQRRRFKMTSCFSPFLSRFTFASCDTLISHYKPWPEDYTAGAFHGFDRDRRVDISLFTFFPK